MRKRLPVDRCDKWVMVEDCDLCSAVYDGLGADPSRIYNNVLATYNRFLVLPAVGPLTLGHVMVVSRSHYPNLRSMGEPALRDYNQLINSICCRVPMYHRSGLVEAEHGSREDEMSGGCIVHSHIHLLPGVADQLRRLYTERDEFKMQTSGLETIKDVAPPYSWVRYGEESALIYRVRELPAQAFRRLVALRLQIEGWDWAAFQRLPLIRQTIKLWEDY